MSGTVSTAAQLYTEFADGQAQGAIVPGYVRNLIASVGALAGTNNQAPIYQNGNAGTALNINPSNGHIQSALFNLGGGVCAITVGNGNEVAGTRIKMELYLTQGSSGNTTVTWGTNVSYAGSAPQPLATANSTTMFTLVSIDGGTTWSVV
jgi:hypothetical protein